jgi:signal transduction histidine kinase
MAATWRGNTYLLASFPVGVATSVILFAMFSVGVALAIVWVGIPILAAALAATRPMARFERRRAAIALREPIPAGYLQPHRRGMLGGIHTAMGDAATWKDMLWLMILLPVLGLAGFTLAVCLWGAALGLVFLPAWYWAVGDVGVDLGAVNVNTLDEAWIGIPVGLVLLTFAVPLTRLAGIGLARLGRVLLAPSERRRVVELERTRAGAVDSQASELQRIERDLHDGAQARLVALAMDLGMAQEKLDSDPAGARALVAEAHSEAKRALVELRDLSRGIYPAILTDRGIGPALSSIAAGNPVEVKLDVELDNRLPAAVEAAAYFVAVEALTNVAKHSGAEHCRVHVVHRGDRLRLDITDDGGGGADPAGAGLTGLRQRVEALDGTLVVEAAHPGTTIRAELPCVS